MKIAVASATFYYLPFEETLDIISKAGFKYLELDMYWKGGEWEMAQHLNDISPQTVIDLICNKGLEISSIHDGGGVVEKDSTSAIDPMLYEYLSVMKKDIECIVFHPPHKKTNDGENWWSQFKHAYISELSSLNNKYTVCVENIPDFEYYFVPLKSLEDLYEFSLDNKVFVNIDTTHFAQRDIDIIQALDILGDRVKSVHLSDYCKNTSHVFPGEGILDLKHFLRSLLKNKATVITLECTLDKFHKLSKDELIRRLRTARDYIENAIA